MAVLKNVITASSVRFFRACPGRKPPFSMVKRGLVTFYNSKLWNKQAAARGAGNRRSWLLSAPRKTDLLW